MFAFFSPRFAQILKYFASSCDCMIAAFRNCVVNVSRMQDFEKKELVRYFFFYCSMCILFQRLSGLPSEGFLADQAKPGAALQTLLEVIWWLSYALPPLALWQSPNGLKWCKSRCYYLHRSRDLVSPICGIFSSSFFYHAVICTHREINCSLYAQFSRERGWVNN